MRLGERSGRPADHGWLAARGPGETASGERATEAGIKTYDSPPVMLVMARRASDFLRLPTTPP
jgi:hypothetical protein